MRSAKGIPVVGRGTRTLMKHVRRLAIVPSQALATTTPTRKEGADRSSLTYFISSVSIGMHLYTRAALCTVNSNEREGERETPFSA